MSIQLNEPVVTEIVRRLNTDLAAVIADINAGVADGFTISEPQQVVDFVPPPGLLTQFPTYGIGDAPSLFQDDEGYSATGVHELIVIAYDQSAEQQALAWQLRRHSQAIVRVVLAGRQLGSAAWGTGLVRVDPGPTLADNPEKPTEWMSWVGVRISAKRDEE